MAERVAGEKIIQQLEVAGAHLNPMMKADLLLGDKSPHWHVIKRFFALLVHYGLMDDKEAEKLLRNPYWWLAFYHVPGKLAQLTKQDPSILWGVLSHAEGKQVTETGKTFELFKCDKILHVRNDEKAWKKVCESCQHYDSKLKTYKPTCPLRAEYFDEMKDITLGFGHFNFDKIPRDKGWVVVQEDNLMTAIHNSFRVYFPFIDYFRYKQLRGENKFEMVREHLVTELSDKAEEIELAYRNSLKRLDRLRVSRVHHHKLRMKRLEQKAEGGARQIQYHRYKSK